MEILPVKTRALLAPKDDLFSALDEALPVLREGDVLCVTSKVVSIHQGRTQPVDDSSRKDDLAKQEADYWIPREETPNGYVMHTIKNNTLIASAGIDESNGNGHYIFWPARPDEAAQEIRDYYQKKFSLRNLGVVITDSRCVILRRGIVGIGIGYAGFAPLKSYTKEKDIFGRPFHMEKVDVVDSLAATAVFVMGEGAEQIPAVVLRGTQVVFTEARDPDFVVPLKDDIYYPLLKVFLR